jgi:hypothetical protein
MLDVLVDMGLFKRCVRMYLECEENPNLSANSLSRIGNFRRIVSYFNQSMASFTERSEPSQADTQTFPSLTRPVQIKVDAFSNLKALAQSQSTLIILKLA